MHLCIAGLHAFGILFRGMVSKCTCGHNLVVLMRKARLKVYNRYCQKDGTVTLELLLVKTVARVCAIIFKYSKGMTWHLLERSVRQYSVDSKFETKPEGI